MNQGVLGGTSSDEFSVILAARTSFFYLLRF